MENVSRTVFQTREKRACIRVYRECPPFHHLARANPNTARGPTLRSWLSEKAAPPATENDVRSAITVWKGTAADVREVCLYSIGLEKYVSSDFQGIPTFEVRDTNVSRQLLKRLLRWPGL